jgi:sugar phosphate isomerase/epimerase
MDTVLLHSLWGFAGSLEQAITQARRHGFDGLEANVHHPALKALPLQEVAARLGDAGLALVVELVSGGDYVPELARAPEDHLW